MRGMQARAQSGFLQRRWIPLSQGMTGKKANGRVFPGRLLLSSRTAGEGSAPAPEEWKSRFLTLFGTTNQRMFDATKSQFTRFQNASTYFGRALR